MTPPPRHRRALIRPLILLVLAAPAALLASAAELPPQAPTPRPAKRVPPNPPMIAMEGIRIETDVDKLNLVTTAGRTSVKLDDGKFAVIMIPIDLRRPIEIAPGQAATLRAFPRKTLIDGKPDFWGFAEGHSGLDVKATEQAAIPPPGREDIPTRYAFALDLMAIEGEPGGPRPAARLLKATIAEGTTVVLRKDHPDHPGRKRFYLITPRHILTEREEEKIGLPAPK